MENRGTTQVFEGGKHLTASERYPVTLGEDWYTDNGGGFGAVTEQFIEDGSYTRLRQASLTYSVDPKLIKVLPSPASIFPSSVPTCCSSPTIKVLIRRPTSPAPTTLGPRLFQQPRHEELWRSSA